VCVCVCVCGVVHVWCVVWVQCVRRQKFIKLYSNLIRAIVTKHPFTICGLYIDCRSSSIQALPFWPTTSEEGEKGWGVGRGGR